MVDLALWEYPAREEPPAHQRENLARKLPLVPDSLAGLPLEAPAISSSTLGPPVFKWRTYGSSIIVRLLWTN